MKKDEPTPPLVFVYLGNPPPKYARDSMIFASGGHKGRIILLTDVDHSIPADRRYKVQRINEWYDPTKFDGFRENAALDPSFMGGFWFHVVERFFVLHQFMAKETIRSLFHAELDVMVMDLNGVADACDAHGTGIFAVMDDRSRALASLFYTNSAEKLDHFLQFASQDLSMRNEMEMIGSYIQKHPKNGHALPSNPFFEDGHPHVAPSQVSDEVGLFDANAFGQWFFGLDPKTVKHRSKNRFRNEMVKFPIENLRFRLGLFDRNMRVYLPGMSPKRLRTLHVHSKIIGRLRFRIVMFFYLWLAKLPLRSTVTHQEGWWASRILDFIIGGSFFRVLTALLAQPLRPAILKISLLLASKTRFPMPNRQRKRLNELIPVAPLGMVQEVSLDILLRVCAETEAEISGALLELEVQFPDARVRVFDGRNSERSKAAFRSHSGEEKCVLDARTEALLAQWLFLASSATLVIRPNAVNQVRRSVMNAHKVQLLQPSIAKWDSASRHARHFFSREELSFELDFEDDWFVVQPDILREMFRHSLDEIERWAHLESKTMTPSLAFSYGTWLWNKHRGRAALARQLPS